MKRLPQIHIAASERQSAKCLFETKMHSQTHKSPGHAEWRGTHSTVNTPFTGAIRFIVYLLRPVLSSREHLLKTVKL